MSNNKYKILVVEDEANICSFIETLLETNGYQALVANTCTMGLTLFASHNPDLIILDLGLPDRDGIELIRTVRQKSMTPIMVLSARTTEQDKIEALDLGANDYITKPFSTGELLARVRAALRLNRYSSAAAGMPSGTFTAQDMTINYERRKVFVAGQEVKLTQTEYNIVAFLSEHAGRVMTYASIVKAIWGDTDCGSTYHEILDRMFCFHNTAGTVEVLEIRMFFDDLVVDTQRERTNSLTADPACSAGSHHFRTRVLDIDLKRRSHGVVRAKTVSAVLQTLSCRADRVRPVCGKLTDNRNIYVLFREVQHRKKRLLRIAYQLDDIRAGLLAVFYDGSGFFRRMTDGSDDNGTGLLRHRNFSLIPA